jgi:capsular polysaccharide export protein
MQRHFLFLQGLPGPFFRILGEALRGKGHKVSRINMNGGDWLDWRIGSAVSYRGKADGWPEWLRVHVIENEITDIILFGELRPRHRAAMMLAAELSLRVFEFEEGYLRPNHVTIDQWGGGQKIATGQVPVKLSEEVPVDGHFRRRMTESAWYWLAAAIARPIFWHYRSHRLHPAWLELLYWSRRRLFKSREKKRSKEAVKAIGDRPFFLFPLQLDGDAQIVGRSTFASMTHALDHVLTSFATHAPADALLLVKRHPFDPDLTNWAAQLAEQSGQWGIADRVFYVSRFDLDPLLLRCAGVVTVNSTVGPLALARGRPVHVLGKAIYDQPGLVDPGPLEWFWTTPQPPEPGAFAAFTSRLKAHSQVNGGFHSEAGLQLLVANTLAVIADGQSM